MRLQILIAADPGTRERAYRVRQRVFVEEQGVSQELERDEHDSVCLHVLALLNGVPVGAARYRATSSGTKIERVAVLAAQRTHGVGARMVQHVLAQVPQDSVAYVHAQESALGFWARMGFALEGERFEEAGIAHRKMFARPQRHAFAITSVLRASPARVWVHAASIEGIRFELGPWLSMSVPAGADASALSERLSHGEVPLPWSLGRAWLLALGVVPFDWDDMTIVELDPGRRFLERSSMFSLRTWQHERSVEPALPGCAVTDRLTWQPRVLVPPALALRIVRAVFRHRHARLAARFGGEQRAAP
ncbi:MAG TPA: GNAT family N-acetyltransferase [Polyangiales bacterium]